MMDKKTIATNVAGGLLLVALTSGATWLITRVDEGGDAIEAAQRQAEIEDALKAALVSPEGETYGAVLSRIDKDVSKLNTAVDILLE